ncbi:hypothetical protein LY474_27825 [Myxococcus stipitatus]|uniref:hypothetical protein n=1 Tax=Myxococcus stipitatus TaxID=83455 RepID=UPI001F36B4A1|nr:hypothetical protein [Myxococcus stipitatus]MCE9671622.1 hypothetical protein [Myxococcus stipitatus]
MLAHPLRRIALLALLGCAREVLAEPPPSASGRQVRELAAPEVRSTVECPSARRVKAVPEVLARQVAAEKSTPALRALLQSVHLGGPLEAKACREATVPASARLELIRARVLSVDSEDLLLVARGTVCGEETLLEGVVLHPSGAADTFCAIPLPFLPGLAEPGRFSTEVTVENLTDPVRQVLRVTTNLQSVEELSYWEWQAGALRSIASVKWGIFRGERRRESTAKVSVVGAGFPRELEVQESVREWARSAKSSRDGRIYEPGSRTKKRTYRLCYRRESPGSPDAYVECPEP